MGTKRGTITESCSCGGAVESAEPGVLKGVKVLGLASRNKRRYLHRGLEKALPLYEGASVYVDHPTDERGRVQPVRTRKAAEKFGQLRNVRVEPDGLRADLHYLTSHPMAGPVAEAAERMPNAFGLSHNVDYTGRSEKDGTLIVESIDKVRSIDLVPNPATTKSLFESETPTPGGAAVPFTLRRYLERVGRHLGPNRRKRLSAALVEMDDAIADTPMTGDDGSEMPEPEEMDALPVEDKTADEHLLDGFKAALHAVIDDESMSPEEKLAKITDLVNAQHELTMGGGDDALADPLPPAAEPNGDEKETYESAVEVAKRLERAGRKVTASLLENLKGLKPEKAAALVESLSEPADRVKTPGVGSPPPRRHHGKAAEAVADPDAERKEFLRRLTNPAVTTNSIPE